MSQEKIEWILNDVKDTIVGRGKERDQPEGERTIPKCVTAFNSITGHGLSNEDGWLFMQILKLCRSVQGSYKYDDYRDGVGYAALRAEEAKITEDKRLWNTTVEAPILDPLREATRQTLEELGDLSSVVSPECDERE